MEQSIWQEAIVKPLEFLFDPTRRIFLGYLFMAGLIALLVLRFSSGRSWRESWRALFNRKVWLGRSARVDYLLFLTTILVKILFVLPYVYLGSAIAYTLSHYLIEWFGMPKVELSAAAVGILYPLSLFLVGDLAIYLLHRALHTVPFLWSIHKVHHSAETMTPFTLYRLHPLEVLLNNFMGILVFGLVTGLFDYWGQSLPMRAYFLGVNVFNFFFFLFGANLRHSHIPFSYPAFLERIFISPYQHQIHHDSVRYYADRNLGSHLALWDWLFGTLVLSRERPHREIRFGVGRSRSLGRNSFWDNLMQPLRYFRRR